MTEVIKITPHNTIQHSEFNNKQIKMFNKDIMEVMWRHGGVVVSTAASV